MKIINKILTIILITLLTLPGIQYFTHIVYVKPLNGVVIPTDKPVLTFKSYFSGEFQDSFTDYFNKNCGFRAFFVQVFNQLDFSLFKISHGDGVVVGKRNYLFERWYINEYMGFDFIGKEKIDKNVQKLSAIRKFLNDYSAKLLVVLAPGKPYYYPEYLPDNHKPRRKQRNYDFYKAALQSSDVPYFDINEWFINAKNNAIAPLFPKTGTHWSIYGGKLAGDSLIKLSGKVLHRPMNQIHFGNIELTSKPQNTDNDLEKISNLLFRISEPELAYPTVINEETIAKNNRPSVIVIGDSFFWTIYDNTLDRSFSSIQYWYYFNSIFPLRDNKQFTTDSIDILNELVNTDLVILMTSTAGLFKMGYGFIDKVYSLIRQEDSLKAEAITRYREKIVNSPAYLKLVKDKASARKIPLDSMITIDAHYLANQKLKMQAR